MFLSSYLKRIRKEIFTKDFGYKIKLMEGVHILMQMVLITMENGLKINNMVMEWNAGLMELNMKETIKMGKKKIKEN